MYPVTLIVGAYLGLSLLIYLLQEFFIFRPEKLPPGFQFRYEDQEIEEHELKVDDGGLINGLRFKVDRPKGIVFYLKGNSRSIKGWGKYARDFTRHGYEVLMVDYRGFGKSRGRRTQETLLNDLDAIYERLRSHVEEEHIIIYGRSLGSGFAAYLASLHQPRQLIMEAPYYSMGKTAAKFLPFLPVSLLLRFPLPTYKWLGKVRCPIHIIHGTNDWLIPFKTSVRLSRINPKLTTLHPIINGGHKDLSRFEAYHEILGRIIKRPKGNPETPDG